MKLISFSLLSLSSIRSFCTSADKLTVEAAAASSELIGIDEQLFLSISVWKN